MNSIDNKKINIPEHIDYLEFQKMAFIYNAINSGWEVKSRNDTYIFTKKHEGKKEVFLDSYLKQFIERNMETNKLS
jgi:hypothetical protein